LNYDLPPLPGSGGFARDAEAAITARSEQAHGVIRTLLLVSLCILSRMMSGFGRDAMNGPWQGMPG